MANKAKILLPNERVAFVYRQDFSADGGWRVTGDGWRLTGDGWWVAGDGWRVKNIYEIKYYNSL